MIGGDVADAIAGGLDRVHLDVGEQCENVGHIAKLFFQVFYGKV